MGTNALTTKPTQEVTAAIEALDLECIKARLIDDEIGKGWTRAYAEIVERRYKRFLILAVKYPEYAEELVIGRDVDEFWHAHILHTLKYAQDCQNVFGRFLHHTPHRRTGVDSEAMQRALAAQKTRLLYKLEFGPDPLDCVSAIPSYCGAAVSSGPAYCGVTLPESGQAYCGVAGSSNDQAYCGVASTQGDAAYCGLAVPAARQAYCGIAAPRSEAASRATAATSHTYCGVAIEDKETAS